jgi:hypothetical protein
MANEAGVPYQTLINLYLRDCVMQHRKVQIVWPSQVSPKNSFKPKPRRGSA